MLRWIGTFDYTIRLFICRWIYVCTQMVLSHLHIHVHCREDMLVEQWTNFVPGLYEWEFCRRTKSPRCDKEMKGGGYNWVHTYTYYMYHQRPPSHNPRGFLYRVVNDDTHATVITVGVVIEASMYARQWISNDKRKMKFIGCKKCGFVREGFWYVRIGVWPFSWLI